MLKAIAGDADDFLSLGEKYRQHLRRPWFSTSISSMQRTLNSLA
jgi:hypothetical protein